jgi:RNA-directed DNA polymerase
MTARISQETEMSYEAVYAWSNLISAFQKASRGKRAKPYVAAFEHGLESNLLGLQDELRKETYLPGGYESFHIHEPKRRLISAAGFRDRVVHHALCNVIEPVFERSFVSASYANRKGRGTHRALDRAQECARRFRYVLQCDLRQFFPSVDHGVLRQILGAKIRDTQIMRLIALILRSGEGVFDGEYSMTWFAGDDLLSAIRPRGLPIGNLTSQFWANCCLNPFDHSTKGYPFSKEVSEVDRPCPKGRSSLVASSRQRERLGESCELCKHGRSEKVGVGQNGGLIGFHGTASVA